MGSGNGQPAGRMIGSGLVSAERSAACISIQVGSVVVHAAEQGSAGQSPVRVLDTVRDRAPTQLKRTHYQMIRAIAPAPVSATQIVRSGPAAIPSGPLP